MKHRTGLKSGRGDSKEARLGTARGHEGVAKQWRVRLFRDGSPLGPAYVQFEFPTADGHSGHLRFPMSELRHPKRLLDRFSDHLPLFPNKMIGDDKAQLKFLKQKASGLTAEVIPNQTGFIDCKSFATWSEVIHSDGRRVPIPRNPDSATPSIQDVKGTLDGSQVVLSLAEYSSYLAFNIGVVLAAPLFTYLALNRGDRGDQGLVITETGVFNLSGRSSAGKTSANLASLSLVGAPERTGPMNFSERGLAEAAARSNDLPLGIDDTEKSFDLIKTIKMLINVVTTGQSKQISVGIDQSKFPQLRWKTVGLSSSPRPISVLAAELGWQMSPGDKARIFDIEVPPPKRGGIFDRISASPGARAKQSIKLIRRLETAYTKNYGHVFPLWIGYLLANDCEDRIVTHVENFVCHVDGKSDGWTKRIAQKFGLVYAAMMLGIDMGLLPWSAGLPIEIATKCYRRAIKGAMTERELNQWYAARLLKSLRRPGRTAVPPMSGKTPLKISPQCMALEYQRGNRTKLGVFDGAIIKMLKTKRAKRNFVSAIRQARVITRSHGHAGTVQVHIPIRRDGVVTPRPAVWELDLKRLRGFIRST